jgi:sugar lactone lactonase YvrE
MNDHLTCNDIAIGRDGSAYVTDSAAPQILRLTETNQVTGEVLHVDGGMHLGKW